MVARLAALRRRCARRRSFVCLFVFFLPFSAFFVPPKTTDPSRPPSKKWIFKKKIIILNRISRLRVFFLNLIWLPIRSSSFFFQLTQNWKGGGFLLLYWVLRSFWLSRSLASYEYFSSTLILVDRTKFWSSFDWFIEPVLRSFQHQFHFSLRSIFVAPDFDRFFMGITGFLLSWFTCTGSNR